MEGDPPKEGSKGGRRDRGRSKAGLWSRLGSGLTPQSSEVGIAPSAAPHRGKGLVLHTPISVSHWASSGCPGDIASLAAPL